MSTPKFILTIESATVFEVQNALLKCSTYIDLKDMIMVDVFDDTENFKYTFEYFSSKKMKDVFFDAHYSDRFAYISLFITFNGYEIPKDMIISLCEELQFLFKVKIYLSETNADLFLIFQ